MQLSLDGNEYHRSLANIMGTGLTLLDFSRRTYLLILYRLYHFIDPVSLFISMNMIFYGLGGLKRLLI